MVSLQMTRWLQISGKEPIFSDSWAAVIYKSSSGFCKSEEK